MSDGFLAARGRPVVSRTTAEDLGSVAHFVIDATQSRIASLVVGKGRAALLVDFENVTGFGPDAVMVTDESALYAPSDAHDEAAAAGRLALLGKRALTDMGNEIGTIGDVLFDPVTGELETFVLENEASAANEANVEYPATLLLDVGHYAAIIRAPAD
jgi:uncharacterized protein YrrD